MYAYAPAVSFKFAKLPKEYESEDPSKEAEGFFAVLELDPANVLN